MQVEKEMLIAWIVEKGAANKHQCQFPSLFMHSG